jgi:hypothetical protein
LKMSGGPRVTGWAALSMDSDSCPVASCGHLGQRRSWALWPSAGFGAIWKNTVSCSPAGRWG